MPVSVEISPSPVLLRDLENGLPFQRHSDRQFFFKTDQTDQKTDAAGNTVTTCLCVTVLGFHVHRIRDDAHITPVPNALIRLVLADIP